MQSYGFKEPELKSSEQIIFKFIWPTNKNENGIDRISRAIMKNECELWGMKVADVESLKLGLRNQTMRLLKYIR